MDSADHFCNISPGRRQSRWSILCIIHNDSVRHHRDVRWWHRSSNVGGRLLDETTNKIIVLKTPVPGRSRDSDDLLPTHHYFQGERGPMVPRGIH